MDKVECYWKLSEMEERFNSSSAGVRTLASGWLLAALAGLGWLLDPNKPSSWAIPLGLLLVAVCVLGVAGVATLWVLDQLVFHRLLNSVFLVGLKMERAEPALPPIRALMMKTVEGRGTHGWELFFYLGPLIVFVVLSTIVVTTGSNTLFFAWRQGSSLDLRWVGYVMLLAQIIVIVWVFAKQRSVGIVQCAAWFGDEAFEELMKKRAFEDIVKASTCVRASQQV
jgi:ABC-type multidrug transport system fused ATPase/permease subunit